ncbi:hypothetical protein D3C87_1808050 [compost metagenome]
MAGLGLDDEDAEAGAIGDRLDDIGRRHDMGARGFGARDDDVVGDRNAGGLEEDLGLVLVHGKRRGQHARMGIGNLEEFEHALDHAAFPEGAVKGIEGNVGF